jgi:hypothetical protein
MDVFFISTQPGVVRLGFIAIEEQVAFLLQIQSNLNIDIFLVILFLVYFSWP